MGPGSRLGLRLKTGKMVVVVGVMVLLTATSLDTVSAQVTDVRLQNGTSTLNYKTGRAQVYVDSRWETLCDDHFKEEAVAFCRMMGFDKGLVVSEGYYGNGTDPMHDQSYFCGVDEDDLDSCSTFDAPAQCNACGFICFNKTEDVLHLRLSDGVAAGKIKMGRVEVKVADLEWGSVCYSPFDLGNGDAANYACQLMGYMYGESAVSGTLPTPNQTRRYRMSKDRQCWWNAQDCELDVTPVSYCNGREQLAAVRCVNAPVRLQTNKQNVLDVGKVEMYVPDQGWSEVCDGNWSKNDAFVVCRELGFVDGEPLCCSQLGGSVWESSSFGSLVTGVQCSAEEAHLANCTRDSSGSGHCSGGSNARASVICFSKPLDLMDTTFKAHLVHNKENTTSQGWGHVQVRYKGYWGDVCPVTFTKNESMVACRMLGYMGGEVFGFGTADRMFSDHSWSIKRHTPAQAPVWISSVSCQGNETSLKDCDIKQWGPPNVSRCGDSAYVICYRSELKLKLRLNTQTPSFHYGKLEVVHDQISGKVCAQNFDDYDASIACKSMNFTDGKVLKGHEEETAVSGPAYLSDVKCKVGDANLFQCDSVWKNPAELCTTASEQAAVSCFNDIELKFGTNHQSGVVVLYEAATHKELGKICTSTFSDWDAKVVCHQIGFANGYALPAGVYGRAGRMYSKLATQRSGLQCVGNETSVWQCPVNSTRASQCFPRTSSYAAVSCFNGEIPSGEEDKYSLDKGPLEGTQSAGQVNIFHKLTTGFICSTYWTDSAANVLCKQMGNTGGVAFYYPGKYSGPYFISGVSCQGSEISLEGCTSMNETCEDSFASGVLCYRSSVPRVALIPEGQVASRGRVSIQVDGEDNRVCGLYWSNSDAAVACKAMGYKDGISLTFPRSDKPVVMFDMQCSGSEESLFQCTNPGWRRHSSASCSRTGDTEAGVFCFKNVKVIGGQTTKNTLSGRLQLKGSQDRWRTVCGGIGAKEAKVACGEVGFTNSTLLSSVVAFSSGYSVNCTGQEASLLNCTWRTDYCRTAARIFCFSTDNDRSWHWSIQNGFHGEVRVSHQGVTGSVCKDSWNDTAADTLCRQKGFKGGVAFGMQVNRVDPTQMMWLQAVLCPPGAQGMGNCTLNTTVSADCTDTNTKAAAVLCYNVSAPVLSLVGGPSKYEGRVQIQYDGVNGTVCNNRWGSYDAIHLCQQLGHSTGQIRSSSYYGSGSGPVYLSGVTCQYVRSNGHLFTCRNLGWKVSEQECQDHSKDAAAICYPSVKLGVSASVGPVLMLVSYSYRLVCGSGFDQNAANVVCREQGFSAAKLMYPGAFGLRSEGIVVTQVRCTGSETRFQDCSMTKYGACRGSYASVVCANSSSSTYNVKLENRDHGYVIVHHFDHNGYICANDYDNQDAVVLCKEAGFLTGFAYRSYNSKSTNPIRWLDNLNCSGSEMRLDQCRQGNQTLAFGKDYADPGCKQASAFCANSYAQTNVEWRLTKDGRTSSSKGRVEVKINGTWGTVCSENFDAGEVNVLCKQLNYVSGNVVQEKFAQDNRKPVWVTLLQCTGREKNLLDCQLKLGNYRQHCFKEAAAICNAGVRLKPSTTTTTPDYGVVQVKQRDGSSWSTVCAAGFSNHTADIICKELGYNSYFYQNHTASYVEQYSFGAANITCADHATQYTQCTVNTSRSQVCPSASYAFLFCSHQQSPPENLRVDLEDFTGALTVSRYGFHGAVCGDSFSHSEAKVACREKGYTNGFAVKAYRSTRLPFVLSMLSCRGIEDRLDQCDRSSLVSSNSDCQNNTVAHLLCTMSAGPIQYRLNPEGGFTGRAEVKIDSDWKRVDGYGFYTSEAHVFCRSAGFYTGRKSYSSIYGLVNYPFAVGRINCQGTEESLLECDGNWGLELSTTTHFTRNVYVTCSQSVRLIRGTTNANGMLQFYGTNGWGPVCGKDFDDKAATVVCRELGFSHGLTYSCCAPHGYSYGRFVMGNVHCNGTESLLRQCSSSTSNIDCERYEYASVACYNTNDTKDYNISFAGREDYTGAIALTYLGTKGRICSDFWDDVDAGVACRELGFANGEAYNHYRSNWYYYDYSGPFWASEFNCTGNETRLQDCPHTGVGHVTECRNIHMAGALCYDTLGLAFKMQGNKTNSGRVLIRVDGEWGTICSYALNSRSAKVFCRSQGFVDGIRKSVRHDTSVSTRYNTDLYCRGNESDLNDCAHEGWSEYRYYCSDASVHCYKNVRLSTSDDVSHGAVKVFRNDTWTFISDDNFDDMTAREVCEELGYEDGRAVCCSAYTGASRYLTRFISTQLSMYCSGDEESLADCIHTGTGFSGLYPTVICKEKGMTFNDTDYKIDFDEESEATGTGRLAVKYLGITGRICAVDWTDLDAMVFCKAKGYNSGFAYSHSDAHEYMDHEEIGPYLLSNFNCSGNESSLLDCPHNDRLSLGNCTTGHSAGVACYMNSHVKYRLVGGKANSGRVEMALDNVWGTVCNDEWDNLDAAVFCRSLNFTSGVAISNDDFGVGSGTIWLKDIQCTGEESAIHQCPHTGFYEEIDTSSSWWWGRRLCSRHENDAAVYCYKNVRLTLVDGDMGGLQVYHRKQWVSVCDDTFNDAAATAACKGLFKDYTHGLAIKGSAFDPMNVSMVIKSIQCTGNESDILECNIQDTGSCASGHYASIACSTEPFVDEGFQVRITNDTYSSDAWGIVEISKKGLWRKICNQGWDSKDASVVCRQLGYKGGVSYTHIVYHERPIGFRNFTCDGTETSLKQCPYDTSPDLEDCAFSDYDAGVVCYNSTGISYSMAGGNSTAGRVEIHYDGEVGGVCGYYWSANDSRVFCRSLDFTDGLPLRDSDFEDPPRRIGQYFLNAPYCKGHEDTLLDCLTTGFNSTYRQYYCYREAYVQCFNESLRITNITLKLADGSTGTSEGRLEVYLSGANRWGTVCDDYWDDYDATVACVQLGFTWGVAITNLTYGRGVGQIWLDNVECKGTETSLDDCIHRGYGSHNCWHSEDAGVVCYSTPKPTLPTTTAPPTTTTQTTTTTTESTQPTTPTHQPTKPTTERPPTQPTTTKQPTTQPTTTKRPTTQPTTTERPTTTKQPTTQPTTTTKPTTPIPPTTTTPPPTTTTTAPTSQSKATSPTAPTTGTTRSNESQASKQDSVIPVAVGVAVPLIIIIVVVVIIAVIVIRRRRKPSVPHQRFSDDTVSSSGDGSIAMHNQMYDGSLEEAGANGVDRMSGNKEISLGGDKAKYVPDQQSANGGASTDRGFPNPMYSVMQPFRSEGTTLSDRHNGHPAGDSNEA